VGYQGTHDQQIRLAGSLDLFNFDAKQNFFFKIKDGVTENCEA
jgi:hypothetical protein